MKYKTFVRILKKQGYNGLIDWFEKTIDDIHFNVRLIDEFIEFEAIQSVKNYNYIIEDRSRDLEEITTKQVLKILNDLETNSQRIKQLIK